MINKIALTVALTLSFTLLPANIDSALASSQTPAPPAVTAEAAILMEQNTGKILHSKNGDRPMFPASTTKTMTALLAVEYGDMDEIVTVGNEVYMIPWDSSKAGFFPGDTVSFRELVYGLMLPSGNDAAYTIAVHLARQLSDEELNNTQAINYFAELMTQRAHELGATNTNFVNPDGYHHPDHITTAMDLALIAQEAMKHPFIQEIVSTGHYVTETWDGRDVRPWGNGNLLIREMRNNNFFFENATGLKTGYTGPAGFCLISSASNDNIDVIAVVLRTNREGRWNDSRRLLEWGLENFTHRQVLEANDVVATTNVSNQAKDQPKTMFVTAAQGFSYVFPNSALDRIQKSISWNPETLDNQGKTVKAMETMNHATLKAPLEAKQVVGTYTISLDGETLFETQVLSTLDILEPPWWDSFVFPGSILAGMSVPVLFIRARRKRRSKRPLYQSSTRRIYY